jgi:hypothetical protein
VGPSSLFSERLTGDLKFSELNLNVQIMQNLFRELFSLEAQYVFDVL